MTCANHPERERIAFCQNCGKPLCQECTRTVGSAVFCEPCLAAKLAGTPPPPGAASDARQPGAPADTVWQSGAGMPSGWQPPAGPNPGLAALLGFIPGVGAMYNGQYAKGVVHLVVFAILVSLADNHGIFGLFIAGWVCYQVIEAYHTAKARRDGTPLPNPFGLNDLGERLGFGKSWPGVSHSGPAAPFVPQGTAPTSDTPNSPPSSAYTAPPAGYPPQYPPQQPSAAAWGSPWENYAPPPVSPIPPYGAPAYPVDPNLPIPRNRFPAGALWLIGLGCIFLVGNAGLFHHFPIHRIIPFFLIGLGVWLFVHKMTGTGNGLSDDGTPAYQYRLFSALRGSIWVILVGVLFLLDSFDILSWSHSWSLFLIVAGLMAVFQRTSFNSAAAVTHPYGVPPASPVATPPPATPSTSIVPSNQHDQEGS
ncbi:B-box zinc finger protein [Tunturibacter empetritectus]|uniref:B box-type domain-containing protein n=2 Tax=Tunturiibacter empetritectus TaxID=3069691 RepID=A0A7W8IGN6_9BACT|nr:B-box zinc finger protein [Edaphobacter lichenicola]MBB5316849.1 hypothetical protein [Edaphobacter lichenicola]